MEGGQRDGIVKTGLLAWQCFAWTGFQQVIDRFDPEHHGFPVPRHALQLLLLLTVPLLADPHPLIRKGQDHFRFVYEIQLPAIHDLGRIWIPLASSDRFQEVMIESQPTGKEFLTRVEKKHGNTYLTAELGRDHSNQILEVSYKVGRKEKGIYREERTMRVVRHLVADRLIPRSPRLKELARQAVGNRTHPMEKARALYGHTLERMSYDKSGTGWGQGDALFACDSRKGNCTDFHSYFIGLCRSLGIPARFAIGFTIPADSEKGEVSGYHCWAEFHAGETWVPVDISEADKHPELTDYYFGHHPANRFEISNGRDLPLEPVPSVGAVNFLIHPLLELGPIDIQGCTRGGSGVEMPNGKALRADRGAV